MNTGEKNTLLAELASLKVYIESLYATNAIKNYSYGTIMFKINRCENIINEKNVVLSKNR